MTKKNRVRGGRNYKAELNKRAKRLSTNKRAAIGVPRGTKDYDDGASIALIAAVMNFGSDKLGLVARPFLSLGFEVSKPAVVRLIKMSANDIMEGNRSSSEVLALAGETVLGSVFEMIGSDQMAENADSVKERKRKKNKDEVVVPLIDTGHLKRNVNYEVRSND
jgi:hypothetical protein